MSLVLAPQTRPDIAMAGVFNLDMRAGATLGYHPIRYGWASTARRPNLPRTVGIVSPVALLSGHSAMHRLLQAGSSLVERFVAQNVQHAQLRAIVRHALDSTLPTVILWGPEHLFLGEKHPCALMTSALQVWAEVWPQASSDCGPLSIAGGRGGGISRLCHR